MAACEKCWSDAYMRYLSNPDKSQSEHYSDLILERKDNPCGLFLIDTQNLKMIRCLILKCIIISFFV